MIRRSCLNMLTVILVWLAFLPSGIGQRGCFNCESITYLDTDFTDKTVLEDADCILGNLTDADALQCPLFGFCYTFDGTITWFVPGYGFVDAHLTKRGCVLGLSFSDAPGGCYSWHESFSYMYQLYNDRFTDRNMTNVDGNLCGCNNSSNCNNKEGALIEVERDGLVPDPNVRGVQCLFCFHQVTNHPVLTHLNVENPSCSHGDLQDVDVYYHTCGSGGVCGVIDGDVTLSGAVFSYFLRDCMYDIQDFPVTTRDDGFRCVDKEEADEFVISHLVGDVSNIGPVSFDGQLCYCTSDLCELSTGVPQDQTSKPTPDNGSTSNAIPKTAVFIVCHVVLTIFTLGDV